MKKKTSNIGCLFLFLLFGLALLLTQKVSEEWIVVGIIILVFIGFLITKNKTSAPSLQTSLSNPQQTIEQKNKTHSISITIQGPGFVSGKISSRNGDEFWKTPISIGENYGGWVYAGKGLAAASGSGIEPALINPDLPIDPNTKDCHTRYLSYWPSYSDASPHARAAYLNWLETGRQDPNADLGYVFLYFYGLERRALHDGKSSESAKSELPVIITEIERLLAIYNKSYSFQNYAGSLLDLLKSKSIEPRQYENHPTPFRGEHELKFEHRVALGQCAVDGKPLPAEWAYTLFRSDPTTYLKTAAKRCPEEFKRLFILRYHEEYGEGFILPRNKTFLKIEHHTASPSFGYGSRNYELKTELPNVTVLTSPVKKLQEMAESCNLMLDSYSRFIKKNKDQAKTFDAIIELPVALWPSEMRKPVMDASMMVESNGKPYIVPFASFQSWFPGLHTVDKQKLIALVRCFGEFGLGIEPDPRFGGGIPSEGSSIALFVDDEVAKFSQPTPYYYSAAMLTLQLAVAVTATDGQVSEDEKNMLARQLDNWLHLNESERRRLHARLCLFLAEPPKLSGLKSRIEDLDKIQREAVGDFLAVVALADSEILPSEITVLCKIFKLLGLDPQSVYSKVHIAASEPITIKSASKNSIGHAIPKPPKLEKGSIVKLDKDRIAVLQADSERISVILGSIFSQEVFELDTATISVENEPDEPQVPTLLGLETEYSALLQILLKQMQWTRTELEELASDRDLMLDGVLEHLNDTAFEIYNKPLFEGTDPIEINQEIAREVLQ